MTPRPRGSRWQRSAVTFGPVGRIAATAVVLVPVYFAIFYNLLFWAAAAIWLLFFLPWALRDIWRRVPTHDDDPQLVIPPEPGPIPAGESILDRPAPRRW